jgi:hypothetical protein
MAVVSVMCVDFWSQHVYGCDETNPLYVRQNLTEEGAGRDIRMYGTIGTAEI